MADPLRLESHANDAHQNARVLFLLLDSLLGSPDSGAADDPDRSVTVTAEDAETLRHASILAVVSARETTEAFYAVTAARRAKREGK